MFILWSLQIEIKSHFLKRNYTLISHRIFSCRKWKSYEQSGFALFSMVAAGGPEKAVFTFPPRFHTLSHTWLLYFDYCVSVIAHLVRMTCFDMRPLILTQVKATASGHFTRSPTFLCHYFFRVCCVGHLFLSWQSNDSVMEPTWIESLQRKKKKRWKPECDTSRYFCCNYTT